MEKNKKNFKKLVSKTTTNTVSRNKERIKNRARLRESQEIALRVLDKLDDLGWTQVKLANELDVSPQQITKIVKGKENLTLETIVKLQEVLKIPILATYYEKALVQLVEQFAESLKVNKTKKYTLPVVKDANFENENLTKHIQMNFDLNTESYDTYNIPA